ncbi:hypothetical protein P872_18235 [Rhodonellum psychrophilum GCM71 = DSM 17998]|uniref:Phosphohistidine phosphatase n=2 Tax=Rhodonellum TaxID=336827 RepID=U5BWX2_9BACT|nr:MULTISPECIES: histidine phosphatase family protein [Rhodonellum]ERM82338.1 hypothetical protein P872_18235 [Rhodonellum psychrophilum GCM71 = DSM 17998]MDO9553098.1 histidine phosphatase family protein [Rhodonellum sp.]SDZ34728.1 phosphohistidine phosphatase [Rhodonellum ikkaensis]
MHNFKSLAVLRHGEAESSRLKNGDFNRNLSEEGRSQVKRLSKLLKKNDFEIDLILSSSANRTKETTELISQETNVGSIKFEDGIYEAEQDELLKMINGLEENFDSVLLIGHNPGLSDLLSSITGGNYINLQPGMMAVMEIQVEEWSMVGEETGILKEVIQ